MKHLERIAALALATLFVAGLGCERTPEDVERWRNAKGGMEKMKEWVTNPSEPMPVRVRALQVMIEEHSPTTLEPTLKEVKDVEARQKILAGGVETVESLWDDGAIPTSNNLDDKKKQKLLKAVKARDAAYFLMPYAEGKSKETLQSILSSWLAEDWKRREKIGSNIGKISMGQVASRAGDKGIENALTWLEKTDDPFKVAKLLRENGGDKIEDRVAEVLVKRAEEKHPDISANLLSAIVNSKSDKVVPYLKKIIQDEKSSGKQIDQAMEALKNIRGERATTFFSKLIGERKGKLRWAAVNEVINIRGKGGILSAATSLPLEKDTYAYPEDDSFKSDAEWFANFVGNQMKDADVSTLSPTLVRTLESERWPVQVLGLTTSQAAHQKGLIDEGRDKLLDAVNNLTSSRTEIPGWGASKRIGELAHETLDILEKKSKN